MALAMVCRSWLPLACKADCAYLFPSDVGSLKLTVVGVFRQWESAQPYTIRSSFLEGQFTSPPLLLLMAS